MKAILELIGPQASGKTVFIKPLIEVLSQHGGTPSIFVIDASFNQGLSSRFLDATPENTMTTLVQNFIQSPKLDKDTREAIDWAFSDLPVTVSEGVDMMTVGPLSDRMPAMVEKLLTFGLNRLIDSYDIVIVDDYHPLIHRLLPAEQTRTIIVATPDQDSIFPEGFKSLSTPSLLITQSDKAELSDTLNQRIKNGDVKLVGRFPHFDPSKTLASEDNERIQDTIYRLNIPLSPKG